MTIVEKGRGIPVVLVPGIQGRWEYFRPTVDALAESYRVMTFSLCDEPGESRASGDRPGFDDFAGQVEAALDDRGLARAVICGISFGGLVALRFAAQHPERTTALILASTPGPGWHLRRTHRTFVRVPWLCAPLFLAGAPGRLRKEIAMAIPETRERGAFTRGLIRLLFQAPLSPSRMAARARLIDGVDNAADCARISAPTLLLTGEPALDHVVVPPSTDNYSQLISGSRAATLERTGHLGCVTRPRAFATIIDDFLVDARLARRSSQDAA